MTRSFFSAGYGPLLELLGVSSRTGESASLAVRDTAIVIRSLPISAVLAGL